MLYKKMNLKSKELEGVRFKQEIEVYPYDLPRELSEIKGKLREVESQD